MMLIQAAANEWKVPAQRVQLLETASSRHKPSGRTTTFGKVAERRRSSILPTEIKLKDPKDWKIAGKPLKRLDTADKIDRQDDLRHRFQAAGHAQCRRQGVSRCSAAR